MRRALCNRPTTATNYDRSKQTNNTFIYLVNVSEDELPVTRVGIFLNQQREKMTHETSDSSWNGAMQETVQPLGAGGPSVIGSRLTK